MATPILPMFVINMDTRPERYAEFQESFPDYPITRVSGVRAANGDPNRGCCESHFKIVQLAKDRGYPWVLIMEDDCAPFPYFRTEFPKVIADLWKTRDSWDIYNGGPIKPLGIRRFYNNICYAYGCACTQFMIINCSAYNRILEKAAQWNIPIDHYYNNLGLRYTISAPMLTYQTASRSDLQPDGVSAGQSNIFIQTMKHINTFWIRTTD